MSGIAGGMERTKLIAEQVPQQTFRRTRVSCVNYFLFFIFRRAVHENKVNILYARYRNRFEVIHPNQRKTEKCRIE